ncbi:MAG: DegT/DnrJ/EryC1/StrS family aminotransferase [Thaumarchaeota archaeon]|nr:DegT/DnrJ/EryC1/StrS family aminotransferase [Nitrososphaerota archaeon]
MRTGPLPVMHPGASFIGREELHAVERVLKSKSLYRFYGPHFMNVTGEFEADMRAYFTRRYAIAVTSGTAALHTALVGLGIGKGDEVILPTYCWVACPDAVVATGARPTLADVDDTLTLDPEDVARRVTKKTRAIVAVHMRGVPADLSGLRRVAKQHGLFLVEDVAQGAGGSYKGKKLGSYGDVATCSFQLNKMITAGEGGAILTDERRTYERSLMFHDVGTPYRGFSGKGARLEIEPFPGVNYRMNELSAAVLKEQLKKLDMLVEKIRANKLKVEKGISGTAGIEFRRLNDPQGEIGVSLVFFVKTPEQAREFKAALAAENITTPSGAYPGVGYDPSVNDGHVFAHWGHIFPGMSRLMKEHEQTLGLLSRAVHLDISPLLSEEDVQDNIDAVKKVAEAIL